MGAFGIHEPGGCETSDAKGKLCAHWAMFRMIRADGTEQFFCIRHMNILKNHRAANEEFYSPVQWVTVK